MDPCTRAELRRLRQAAEAIAHRVARLDGDRRSDEAHALRLAHAYAPALAEQLAEVVDGPAAPPRPDVDCGCGCAGAAPVLPEESPRAASGARPLPSRVLRRARRIQPETPSAPVAGAVHP